MVSLFSQLKSTQPNLFLGRRLHVIIISFLIPHFTCNLLMLPHQEIHNYLVESRLMTVVANDGKIPKSGDQKETSSEKLVFIKSPVKILMPKVRSLGKPLSNSGMVKMFHGGNIARPRKTTSGWFVDPKSFREFENPSSIKPRRNHNVFQIGMDNDFTTKSPHDDYQRKSHPPGESKPVKNTSNKISFKKHLEHYCANTTLHGLRYVGDSSLSWCERTFWLVSFVLAIGFAAYYISNIYEKWKSSPVIISFSPFDADLSAIPFPAITICNMNQAKKNEAKRILIEGSDIEKKLLDDSCNGNANFTNSENIAWEALRDFLVRVGNSCSDMIKSCKWGSDDNFDCSLWFNNDLTDEGLCCSFNRLPPEKIFRNAKDIVILNQTYPSKVYDWNPEFGFGDAEIDDNIIPKRPLGAGAHLGLSVTLDAQVDNYYCSSTNSIGFKVIMSNPIETPKMADFGFLVSPGFETRISIEPSIREATDSLRNVAIEKRQCYFSNERPLQYYRWYTKGNCASECFVNFSKEFQNMCADIILPGVSDSLKRCPITPEAIKSGAACNCKITCYDTSFSYCKTAAKLWKLKDSTNDRNEDLAVVKIFFSKNAYSKTVKQSLYAFTDLVSYSGGLLSVFLGFSLLVIMEIIWAIKYQLIFKIAKVKLAGNKNEAIPPFLH